MTTQLEQAARLALEALESKYIVNCGAWRVQQDNAASALRAALDGNQFNPDWDAMAVMVEEQQRMAKRIEELEQPAQDELVAWVERDGELVWNDRAAAIGRNLYTRPQAREPLTDEQLREIENKINPNMRWRSSDEEGITLYPGEYYDLVRAIEQVHGIGEKK